MLGAVLHEVSLSMDPTIKLDVPAADITCSWAGARRVYRKANIVLWSLLFNYLF